MVTPTPTPTPDVTPDPLPTVIPNPTPTPTPTPTLGEQLHFNGFNEIAEFSWAESSVPEEYRSMTPEERHPLSPRYTSRPYVISGSWQWTGSGTPPEGTNARTFQVFPGTFDLFNDYRWIRPFDEWYTHAYLWRYSVSYDGRATTGGYREVTGASIEWYSQGVFTTVPLGAPTYHFRGSVDVGFGSIPAGATAVRASWVPQGGGETVPCPIQTGFSNIADFAGTTWCRSGVWPNNQSDQGKLTNDAGWSAGGLPVGLVPGVTYDLVVEAQVDGVWVPVRTRSYTTPNAPR